MAAPFPSDNVLLSKGFEPIHFECDYDNLVIEGEIPKEISGRLYRVGPNPQFLPRGTYSPLLADGMIHAFDISDGAVSYRNRWVRTQQWQRDRAAGRSLFSTTGNPRDADPQVVGLKTDGVANTNLVWHAGKLLALEEGHAPIEIQPDSLETLGQWDFDGKLPDNMTAHPKIDPNTGELLFFANFPRRDLSGTVELYVADSEGKLLRQRRISAPFASLIHDFAVTQDFVIFFVCPVTVSVERARAGGPPVAWEPEQRTWIGIVPRHSLSSDVRWLPMPACMAWHAMNAFNEGDTVYLDVCRQDAAAFPSVSGEAAEPDQLKQYLTRWRVTLSDSVEIASQRLSEIVCEYPTIDARRSGRPYRYGYVACCGGPGTDDPFHRGIGRFDHATGRMDVFHAGETCAVSEPIFVPRSYNSDEGDGFLLAVHFDEIRRTSHLAILDAGAIQNGPIGRALLEHRVPVGFHGTWLSHKSRQRAPQHPNGPTASRPYGPEFSSRVLAMLEVLSSPPRTLKRLAVHAAGVTRFVKTTDVAWIRAAENYSEVHAAGEDHLIRMPINKLEGLLDPELFLRIHRSLIINCALIRHIQVASHGEYLITMSDGAELRSGRSYRQAIRALRDNAP